MDVASPEVCIGMVIACHGGVPRGILSIGTMITSEPWKFTSHVLTMYHS
jgi:mannose/fructose-specific phosphotransferase system component IIA